MMVLGVPFNRALHAESLPSWNSSLICRLCLLRRKICQPVSRSCESCKKLAAFSASSEFWILSLVINDSEARSWYRLQSLIFFHTVWNSPSSRLIQRAENYRKVVWIKYILTSSKGHICMFLYTNITNTPVTLFGGVMTWKVREGCFRLRSPANITLLALT